MLISTLLQIHFRYQFLSPSQVFLIHHEADATQTNSETLDLCRGFIQNHGFDTLFFQKGLCDVRFTGGIKSFRNC